MNQTDPTAATPEQLLQFLELQRLQSRGRRAKTAGRRAIFLTVGVLAILAGTAVALFVLFSMLGELPHAPRGSGEAGETVSTHP